MINALTERFKAKMGSWASDILTSPFVESAVFRYQHFSDRERFVLRILFGFCVLLLVVFVLLQPAINYSSESRQAMLDSRGDYQWIKAHIREAEQLSTNDNRQTDQEDLLTLASVTANEVGLVFQRYEPDEEGRMRFHVEAVIFSTLLKWIEILDQQRGVVIVQITIDKHSENGKVNAMVQLRG